MATPFITWLGGKRRLLKSLRPLVPAGFSGRYFEPFVGGGALLFDQEFENAVIGDANPYLMAAYQGVKMGADRVADSLLSLPDTITQFDICKDFLINVDPKDDPITYAAAFIFLNKCCFGGIWNCRKDGRLSTPYNWKGSPTRLEYAAGLIRKAGPVLQGVEIRPGNWRETVSDAAPGDLVFFDPPYLPADTELKGEGFRGYVKGGFGLEQQEELAQWVHEAHDRGIHVIATNTDCVKARELYSPFPTLVHATVRSCSSHADQPLVGELIVNATNF